MCVKHVHKKALCPPAHQVLWLSSPLHGTNMNPSRDECIGRPCDRHSSDAMNDMRMGIIFSTDLISEQVLGGRVLTNIALMLGACSMFV